MEGNKLYYKAYAKSLKLFSVRIKTAFEIHDFNFDTTFV